MALRISDLTNANTFVGTDEFEFSLAGATGSRKVTGAKLRTQLLAGGTGFTSTDPLNAGVTAITSTGAADIEIQLSPTHASYTGKAVSVVATRPANPNFYHFYATSDGVEMAYIRGDGAARFAGAVIVAAGGMAITGTVVQSGTFTTTGAFGCNGSTAQTSLASGGALAAYAGGGFGLSTGAEMSALHALVVKLRAALVANGIMS